jgi:hypothetical protein
VNFITATMNVLCTKGEVNYLFRRRSERKLFCPKSNGSHRKTEAFFLDGSTEPIAEIKRACWKWNGQRERGLGSWLLNVPFEVGLAKLTTIN